MTYDEAVAEKKRREQAGTWKSTPAAPAGEAAAPAAADPSLDYDAAIDEAAKRAAKARVEGAGTWGAVGSDIGDVGRMLASGLTGSGSNYVVGGINTALGNIGSTIAPGWVDDPTFADEVRKDDVEDKMARARLEAGWGIPGAGRGLEMGAGAVGLGKLGVLKPALKLAGTGAAIYGANQIANDPLAAYGTYAGARDILAKLFKGRK